MYFSHEMILLDRSETSEMFRRTMLGWNRNGSADKVWSGNQTKKPIVSKISRDLRGQN
jgi:hypothetical protein